MTNATATIAILLGLTLGAAYLVAKKRKNAQRGAMMALLALLCAFAQGAHAQNYDVWDGHSEPTTSRHHWVAAPCCSSASERHTQ